MLVKSVHASYIFCLLDGPLQELSQTNGTEISQCCIIGLNDSILFQAKHEWFYLHINIWTHVWYITVGLKISFYYTVKVLFPIKKNIGTCNTCLNTWSSLEIIVSAMSILSIHYMRAMILVVYVSLMLWHGKKNCSF